jgi:hypothetical protein
VLATRALDDGPGWPLRLAREATARPFVHDAVAVEVAHPPRRKWTAHEAVLALILLVVYGWAFPFFPGLNNPNELVRIYMARAMAEHRTYVIGLRTRTADGQLQDHGPVYDAWGYVNDKALVCNDPRESPPLCAGRLYSAKAPGASLAAVPVVAALDFAFRTFTGHDPSKDAYVLTLRWVLSILPSVLAWLLIRRFLLAMAVPTAVADVALLAGALGSASLTYGQMFAGHQLSGLGLLLAFLPAFWPWSPSTAGATDGSPARTTEEVRALLVGLGAALASTAEYPAAPAAAIVVAGWILARRPSRSALVWALAGALPSLALTVRFHTLAFGAPWHTAYRALENPTFVQDLGTGPLGFSWPSWERISGSLFSPRLGLFFWAPWILLVLLAADGLFRAAARARAADDGQHGAGIREAVNAGRVACAVIGYYLVFQLFHSLWRSGWTVGPRYITPVGPFAAIAIALSFRVAGRSLRRITLPCFAGAGAAAIVATGLTSLVCQGFPPETAQPLVEVVGPLLRHGYVARNPLQGLGVPGVWSALPTLLGLALAVFLCLRAAGRGVSGPVRLTLAVFLVLVGIQWTWPRGIDPAGEEVAAYLADHWTPLPPPGARPFLPSED